jgi:putative Ca2+/H+ antiporter (TMEM165/GDT1 family)
MNDAVMWGSIISVVICIVIFVYIGIMAVKKINTDHSED